MRFDAAVDSIPSHTAMLVPWRFVLWIESLSGATWKGRTTGRKARKYRGLARQFDRTTTHDTRGKDIRHLTTEEKGGQGSV